MSDQASLQRLPAPIREHRDEIIEIASRRGARNVRVFGSTVRDEATRQSDVDFLVELDDGRNLLDLGGLQMDLQDLLGRPVDVKTESSLREDIRQRVTAEAVVL